MAGPSVRHLVLIKNPEFILPPNGNGEFLGSCHKSWKGHDGVLFWNTRIYPEGGFFVSPLPNLTREQYNTIITRLDNIKLDLSIRLTNAQPNLLTYIIKLVPKVQSVQIRDLANLIKIQLPWKENRNGDAILMDYFRAEVTNELKIITRTTTPPGYGVTVKLL